MVDLLEIKDPSFIKSLSKKELKELAEQIRVFLIENISKTGGHLSSNLGIVEITIAMYYVFDYEKDKFLFDVGHQSYVHKILTGRAKDFVTLRKYKGMSGYINKEESKYDVWESGHSSTTISAMAGMLSATDNKEEKVVTLIGDSSIMNGTALEGLNFLGTKKELRPIIILNDNKMGITRTVGALSNTLLRLRGTKLWSNIKRFLNFIFPGCIANLAHKFKRGIKGMLQGDNIFEDMGFDYYGPIKGNDIHACIKSLKRIKNNKEPVILHILTKKGMGYSPSEQDVSGSFHGVQPFDIETGRPLVEKKENNYSYSAIVSNYLVNKRDKEHFYVVTPAMTAGSELEDFQAKYPKDFYDVGIAEEHAAVMSAGMALSNKRVVLLYYSTFAQRAYDYLLNDISRQNLNVIIGIDRAGVVGADGATHQGIYDISMFAGMPNITITMPKDPQETIGLFNYAFTHQGPIVIRYPRKNVDVNLNELDYDLVINPSWEVIKQGKKCCVISYGPDVLRIEEIINKHDLNVGLVNARFISPIDKDMLEKLTLEYDSFLILEQVVNRGTLYHSVLEYLNENNHHNKVKSMAFSRNQILPHGKIEEILNDYGMSEEDILNNINNLM